MDKSLVEGRAEVTKAVDTLALSERLRESATKRECDVLCCVVVIDPRVTLCLYGHIQQAVRTDLLQRTQVAFSFGGLSIHVSPSAFMVTSSKSCEQICCSARRWSLVLGVCWGRYWGRTPVRVRLPLHA